MSDESLIELPVGNLKMLQARNGYRHAIDPYLLCHFVGDFRKGAIVDLGTATGVIPLILAATTGADKIVGIEIQQRLADRARRNVRLNEMDDRIDILQSDIRRMAADRLLPAESFDCVVANPPYRKPGTGKISPEDERASCRHELFAGLEDFVRAAWHLLKDRGRLALVFLPERLPELMTLMQSQRVEPKRLRCVHSRLGDPVKMILVEGRKNARPGLMIDPPLLIYDRDVYSPEVRDLFSLADREPKLSSRPDPGPGSQGCKGI